MQYTPEAIITPEFDRTWRGFDPEQVEEHIDDLLQIVARQQEQLQGLRQTNATQEAELRDARDRERHVLDALSAARGMAESIESEARSEAQQIVDDARQQARRILDDAFSQRDEVFEQINSLELQRARLTRQLRQILDTHMRALDANFPEAEQSAMPPHEGAIVRSPRHSTPTLKIKDDELQAYRAHSNPEVDDARRPTVPLGDEAIEHLSEADCAPAPDHTLMGHGPTTPTPPPTTRRGKEPTPPAQPVPATARFNAQMRSLKELQQDLDHIESVDDGSQTLLGMFS